MCKNVGETATGRPANFTEFSSYELARAEACLAMGLSRMSLLAALPLASGFSPVARPALARVHRAGAVSMIDGGFTSWLADAAILLPDADTASAAAGAMVEAVAEDSWFDT